MTAGEVVGTTPDGRSIVVDVASDRCSTLVAFLSSSCLSCETFWRAFDEHDAMRLAGREMQMVLVTHGSGREDPARVAARAPRHLLTVMSESAWSDYDVPGSPYFVLVDGPDASVIAEGTASSWPGLIELLTRTDADQQDPLETRSLPRSWLDPRIEVRNPSSDGRGLFALEPIPAAAMVLILCGRVATDAEAEALPWRQQESRVFPLDDDANLIQASDDDFVALNHSCDPNVWLTDRFVLGARRDIEPGDELTVDYATFTADPDWAMQCRCGSVACRGLVRGDDWGLPALQDLYAGHFSHLIARRIEPASSVPSPSDTTTQGAMNT